MFGFITYLKTIVEQNATIVSELKQLHKLVTSIRFECLLPGPVSLSVISKDESMLICQLSLPPLSAADVVKRKLVVTIDTETKEYIIEENDLQSLTSPSFKIAEGATLTGSLIDIDNAGNASVPREFTLIAHDTIAPPQPGVLGLIAIEEIES